MQRSVLVRHVNRMQARKRPLLRSVRHCDGCYNASFYTTLELLNTTRWQRNSHKHKKEQKKLGKIGIDSSF